MRDDASSSPATMPIRDRGDAATDGADAGEVDATLPDGNIGGG
jgi:hypothetical protein